MAFPDASVRTIAQEENVLKYADLSIDDFRIQPGFNNQNNIYQMFSVS